MRTNDADNVRLTAEARQRALYVKTLKERKMAYASKLTELRAEVQRNKGVKGARQWKDEQWALMQGMYLTEIEYRDCLHALAGVRTQLQRRLMMSDAELSKLIDP